MFPTRRITLGGDVFRDEYSLSFDGTNDYVDCGDVSAFDIQSFTISAWIKINDVDYNGILNHYDSNKGYNFFVNNNGVLRTYIGDNSGANSLSAGTALVANKWYHCATTYTSGTRKIYLNGVEDGSSSTAVTITFPSGSLIIGEAIDAYMNGNISDVALYSSALSASQIKTIYNGREPYNHKEGVASSNLVSWWRMGDGALDSFNLIGDEVNATIGNELISNLDFTSGWSSSDTVSSSTTNTFTTTEEAGLYDENTIVEQVVGKVYKCTLDATTTASSGFRVKNAGEGTIYLEHGSTSNYSDSFYFIAKHATFQIRNISAGTITVNSISVKEVNGNAGVMTNMSANDFTGDTP